MAKKVAKKSAKKTKAKKTGAKKPTAKKAKSEKTTNELVGGVININQRIQSQGLTLRLSDVRCP